MEQYTITVLTKMEYNFVNYQNNYQHKYKVTFTFHHNSTPLDTSIWHIKGNYEITNDDLRRIRAVACKHFLFSNHYPVQSDKYAEFTTLNGIFYPVEDFNSIISMFAGIVYLPTEPPKKQIN